MNQQSKYMKVGDVAKLIGVNRSTLWRWEHYNDNDFPKPIRIGKSKRYLTEQINNYLKKAEL